MSAEKPIRVILADDHRRVHEQVADILRPAEDISLVGQASNGEEVIELCRELLPDLVLMDVVMPGHDGVAATQQIRAISPAIKILVLSSYQDDESVRLMLSSGASGYVTKRDLATKLVPSIRATYLGQAVFSSELIEQMISPSQLDAANEFRLSDRELEVLKMMGQGLNNNQIAYALTISRSTVNFHIANILRKLGVETRAEALVVAARNNLI